MDIRAPCRIALAALLAFAPRPAAAQPSDEWPAAKAQQMFLEAGQAYDQGRLADAVEAYETLRGRGLRFQELFFNLGNAYFRQGDLGRAIVNYRRAWVLNPGDPDTRANLRYALQTAGVPEPALRGTQRFLFRASRETWRWIAVGAWWLAAGLAGAYLWSRSRPAWMAKLAVALLAVMLVAAWGALAWDRLCRAPEIVVEGKGHEALFAPLAGSTAHFALPEGSIGRVVEHSGNWIRIASGGQEGWIQAEHGLPVCYWLVENSLFSHD
ncbi:MAG TPA: tetratricopeptide repeat protein [Kiritimatiellia bacterium]|nr:tetratricopeptide repeat protein [Kiritimatiellia bacterium]HRZ10990.1 tetratricopeptide repeat protein [Kiritimatiellia bacterium]HSA18563.1 tetratricopeptide repeat protein [Kiritimatiellia bacterium]